MTDFDKPYDPKEVEERIYKSWENQGFFNPDTLAKRKGRIAKRFATLLPPPNITGSLHMGHALNATIQDILIRYHRMNGYQAVWFPGTDHAGIATQSVVEKELKKEGLSRWDLGREKFVEKVWQWREKYGNIILDQLKKLGASCDWSRTRFTMDKEYSDWVKRAFIHYWDKGLIYRGYKVVNWCPRCQTSLSDLEIEYKEEKTKLWYIRYPLQTENSKLKTQNYIVVATTRPETMLGDAAVAVNPKDERYKNLVGKKAVLPIKNREIPVIADKTIDPEFGTGAVKVTPAHSIVDSEIAERNKLPFYQIINEKGRMTEEAGLLCNSLKILECREKVIQELEKLGLIEKIEDYTHNIGVCYRCGTVIEPLISKQWFVKMKNLAQKALKAVKSKQVKIIPRNFEKPYFSWLENIKDWCISRQIWWGHQIPVWFCRNQQKFEVKSEKLKVKSFDTFDTEENFVVTIEKPKQCPFCKSCGMEQSQDVLDTWFSSALWPFAGLSEADIKKFYPSDILVTARDIINLWVGRMIFSGLEFMKKIPFSTALIHATILAKSGQRMSKSLGTGIDPLELVEKYGADATRFGLIWQAMGNQDILWDETAITAGKKFANKIWNAARFVLQQTQNLKLETQNPEPQTDADKKILNEFTNTKKHIEADLKNYDFGQALHKIYNFFWHDFCDVYIETAKKQLTTNNLQLTTENILSGVLFGSLKILHPFMPFITEKIYQNLPIEDKKWLIIEPW